jgi:hypothetical protein
MRLVQEFKLRGRFGRRWFQQLRPRWIEWRFRRWLFALKYDAAGGNREQHFDC